MELLFGVSSTSTPLDGQKAAAVGRRTRACVLVRSVCGVAMCCCVVLLSRWLVAGRPDRGVCRAWAMGPL
eukprot:45225-Alexandrium_andersonii.AAC.1